MFCYKDRTFCFVGNKCANAFKHKACRALTKEQEKEVVESKLPLSFCGACVHFKKKGEECSTSTITQTK